MISHGKNSSVREEDSACKRVASDRERVERVRFFGGEEEEEKEAGGRKRGCAIERSSVECCLCVEGGKGGKSV